MVFDTQQIFLILIVGLALASVWFWIYSLIKQRLTNNDLRMWLKIIVPQGILISYGLYQLGIIYGS